MVLDDARGQDLSLLAGSVGFFRLSWDRTHEEFDAYVVRATGDGCLVVRIHDGRPLDGYKWIELDEVVTASQLGPSSFSVRALKAVGYPPVHFVPFASELSALCKQIEGKVVAIYGYRYGSSSFSCGRLHLGSEAHVEIAEIDVDGSSTGDTIGFDFDEIASLEWDTTYLQSIAALITGLE